MDTPNEAWIKLRKSYTNQFGEPATQVAAPLTVAESINEFQQLINRIEDNTERAKAILDTMLSLYK